MFKFLTRFSKIISTVLMTGVFLAACSSSPKTQVVKMGDNDLSRQQITHELAQLDEAQRNVDANKGMNGTNVAAFLFFWPALAYTYTDANEASRLIEQRRSHLNSIYNQKYGRSKA